MKLTSTLATLAVLASTSLALEGALPAGHGVGAGPLALARRNHPLGQSFAADAADDSQPAEKRGFELVKRRETAAQKKAKARAAAKKKSAAVKAAKAAASKAKVAAAKKAKASASAVSKSRASSLKKYSSSSKKAASASKSRASSSLRAYSSSSKKAASAAKTTAKSTAKTTAKATTTTSKAATATNGATTSKKKGLGYNTASYTTAFGSSLAWAYDWANAPGGTLLATTEFVPMMWGSGSVSGWADAATSAIKSGSTALLGFNEPDASFSVGGSDITPAAAATLWKANIEPFAGKATLVSPAITNGGSPMGQTWLSEFMGNCSSCTIDAIAMHWYDTATNTAYFTNYFDDAAKKYNQPIWITEFMGSGTVAQQETFLKTVIPYLEGKQEIARYAAFGDFAGTFVNSDGSLTALGTVYKETV